MSLTPEQEATLRANTTTGDPFEVHSASVAAWGNVWALLDSARASLETEREMRQSLESSLANLAVIARGGDPNLPVSGPFVVVRDDLVALRRNYESVVDSAQRATDSECARWQKRLNFLHVEYGVDGSGCDSGDPLDVIESEARGVITRLTDELAERTKQRDEVGVLAAEQGVLASQRGIQVNALRRALEDCECDALTNGMGEYESHDPKCGRCAALAETPAQSLAAHDAEVLERAVAIIEAKRAAALECAGRGVAREASLAVADILDSCRTDIRALAAQAATRTEERWECPSCGIGVDADEDGCCAICGADCTEKPATVTIKAQEVNP